jgi:hypothetical protein
VTWLKQQGADTVADLRELPPGTYLCKDLADDLGLPLLKAQRLLSALEGTTSSAIHHEAALHCIPQPFAPYRHLRETTLQCNMRQQRACGVGASQQHAAKAPAPIQPVPPPPPQLAPMFAHMAIAASPPVRMRTLRTAYPRLAYRRGLVSSCRGRTCGRG